MIIESNSIHDQAFSGGCCHVMDTYSTGISSRNERDRVANPSTGDSSGCSGVRSFLSHSSKETGP